MAEAAGKARFEALDILRGLAILGMALSGMVPYRTLPAWMYHAQLPPPSRDFDPNVFGLTWVDVVFPMFLFAMGAAIPLSLSRRLERGETNWGVLKGLLGRGLLIAAYALIGQHLRPYVLADNPGTGEWIISLVGFVLVGVILLRWPPQVPTPIRRTATAAAWIGAAFIIVLWNYPDGTRGFANYRNDVILMVLANVAVSGGAIWLWTRNRPLVRWVIVACVAAIFLAKDSPGIAKSIWDWDPTNYLPFKNGPHGRFLPILYHFEYHKYLLLVLPATFVGDILRSAADERGHELRIERRYWWPLVAGGPLALIVACAGLTARALPATAAILAAILLWVLAASALAAFAAALRLPDSVAQLPGPRIVSITHIRFNPNFWRKPQRPNGAAGPTHSGVESDASEPEEAPPTHAVSKPKAWPWSSWSWEIRDAVSIAKLFQLGAFLLIVGLLAEPIGGGIRKDPATISYFFVTGGLCCLLLGSFAAAAPAIEGSRIWKSIRDTGVNPIVGYLTITNLVWGIVGLTGLEVAVNNLTQNPWLLLLWAFLKTIFVALVTAWFTRRKIFLRA